MQSRSYRDMISTLFYGSMSIYNNKKSTAMENITVAVDFFDVFQRMDFWFVIIMCIYYMFLFILIKQLCNFWKAMSI